VEEAKKRLATMKSRKIKKGDRLLFFKKEDCL
jgi:ASC-1-like (ASCH) protein